MTGYSALREGVALLDLTGRGKIKATGEDRARLLHAMTTNHVQQLQPGQGCYAFFLNAQGHILSDVRILARADHLLLDTEPETREKVFQHLDKFIIADDVTLEDLSAELVTIGVEGPGAADLLGSLGVPLPEAEYSATEWDGHLVVRTSGSGGPGYWLLAPAAVKAELIERLTGAGAVPATPDELRTVRLENGKPRYGEEITEASLPQETQVPDALHFSKGCYLGQEIVERIRSRGHVNRLLTSLRIQTEHPPAAGAKVMAGEKEAGSISSAAFSPALRCVAAMGLLRAEFAKPRAAGAPLTVNGAGAEVVEH